jgi:hypothetical protein
MKKITYLILLLICFTISTKAQEIQCSLDIVTEGISQDHIINLESFKSTIEDYINSNRFSDIDWEGPKIPVSISIQLMPIGKQNYSANMFIISKRTISEEDEEAVTAMMFEDRGKWNFEFSSGVSLSYDYNRYDNIASILDFYMLMIIGIDLDSYGELDGDKCFQRAKNIFDIGALHSAPGWSSYTTDYGRHTMVGDLNSPRLDGFRKLVLEYYLDGMELLKSNKTEALSNIENTINSMADFKERYMNSSHYMDSWFYTKCNELCDLFRGYKNTKVFRNLMFLDPTNTSKYEASKDNKK